jgi:sugar phosphate isomerase/epimerase
MNIINPNYKINKDDSIFGIRQNDYDKLLDTVAQILEPVKELGFDIIELGIKDSRFSERKCKNRS